MSYCLTCMGRGLIQNDMYHPAVVCIHCKGSGVEKEIPMITVIGLIGKMRAGKTTAAKYLEGTGAFTRLRVADGLKRMLRDGLGISEEYIDGSLKDAPCEQLCGVPVRHAMVTLGTEWGREMIHPDLWVKTIDTQMREFIQRGHTKFVIDDIRFLNEAEWIKNLNRQTHRHEYDARLIRIVRTSEKPVSLHVSEVQQEKIVEDATVFNDYTLDILYDSMREIVARKYH